MRIGETILKLREEKKMSQEEFAEYFHVTRQTISNWEKAKSFPDLQTLVKISDMAGVSVDAMLRDNFEIVEQIDKKIKHLKFFKIATALIAVTILVGSACYMQACLAYVNFEGISNADIRKIFGLGEKEKSKASRIIANAVDGGYIKVMDPDTAPRYKKYIPYWA